MKQAYTRYHVHDERSFMVEKKKFLLPGTFSNIYQTFEVLVKNSCSVSYYLSYFLFQIQVKLMFTDFFWKNLNPYIILSLETRRIEYEKIN